MSDDDGAATLAMMTVRAVCNAMRLLPERPCAIYVVGGGRRNASTMRWLADLCDLPVFNADDLGWNGDFLEAEAFAYLAVRSLMGLPLSLPTTTGVSQPMTGGAYHPAAKVKV